jgi:hypothetical protein
VTADEARSQALKSARELWARVTGGAWLQDRAGLGLRADNARIICRMVITVDLKKTPPCGATRCGVSTCAPRRGFGHPGAKSVAYLAKRNDGRRWGFRRRNNRIFINVDIDPDWLGLRLETY